MEQSFTFVDGYLKDCRSVLLQADGSFMFETRHFLTGNGIFHIPAGVNKVRVLLVSGDQGGTKGQNGFVGGSGVLPGSGVAAGTGEQGANGIGAYVWAGVINVNQDTDYSYSCGVGGSKSNTYGVPGEIGTHTTFGVYSSENGEIYPVGYTDLANGDSFGRTGVSKPIDGTGDGGKGGEGGEAGSGYWKQLFWPDGRPRGWDFVVIKKPGLGKPGVDGADGCVVIYWDKEAET